MEQALAFYVLIVTPDENTSELVQKSLRQFKLETKTVQCGEDAISLVASDLDAIIVLDYKLPDMTGLDLIDILLEKFGKIPFIVLTEEEDELDGIIMTETRLGDCLLKGTNFIHRLPRSFLRLTQQWKKYPRFLVVQADDTIHTQLLVEQERTARILEGTNAGTFDWDVQSGDLTIDERWAEIIGYSLEELVPATEDTWKKTVHPDDIDAAMALLEAHLQGRSGYYDNVFRQIHKDGRSVWVNARGKVTRRSETGKPLNMSGIHLDITKRKLVEIALHESEHRFSLFMKHLPEMAFIKDEQGRYVFVNEALCTLAEKSQEQILGGTDETVFSPDVAALLSKNDEQVLKMKKTMTLEESSMVKGKQMRFVSVKFPFYIPGGCINGVAGIAFDVSEIQHVKKEKEELKAQLRQAQKMESIGTLAGGIAHDFNNILSALLTYVELAKQSLIPNTSAWQYLCEIEKASTRAAELSARILSFGHPGDQTLKPIRIQSILNETLELLRETIPTTVSLVLKMDPDCKPVMANTTQMHQVIMNLCTNAFHALENIHGTLTVRLDETIVENDLDTVKNRIGSGCYARISVSDDGCGMDEETKARIFESYYTTKSKNRGTGLGLTTVLSIVTEHGGGMTVSSDLHKGTTFTIYLPIYEQDKKCLQVKSNQDAVNVLPGTGENILIVDDEAPIVDALKLMLQKYGYKTAAFTSSVNALETFLSKPDSFDMVITDQTMPQITGVELAQKILSIRSDIPIILCTGFSETVTENSAKALGVRDFIMKPILTSELIKRVQRVFENDYGYK